MFTGCPQCNTVFRVTANQLRAARGDVRCGNCAHVFNAMESLVDELPGVSESELAAEGQSAEDTMEFDAPEQAWGEIFVEAPKTPDDIALDGELEAITANPDEWRSMLAELGVEPADIEPDIEDEEAGIAVAAASLTSESEDSHAAFSLERDEEGLIAEPAYVIGDDAQNMASEERLEDELEEQPPFEAEAEAQPEMEPAREAAAENDAEPEPEPDPDYEHIVMESAEPDIALQFGDSPTDSDSDFPLWETLNPAEESRPARRGGAGWAAAAVLLAVALVGQLVHLARDTLAAHPRYGEFVREAYARIDQRLYPAWSLDSFYIRRSEALAGGSAPEALDISAALEVTGAQPVGLPLVRVTLRDQWSNTVGRRVFLPEEYLAASLPPVVAPGTRIPVALSLADPGTTARGYEVDLCLQRRQTGLECQLAERPYRP